MLQSLPPVVKVVASNCCFHDVAVGFCLYVDSPRWLRSMRSGSNNMLCCANLSPPRASLFKAVMNAINSVLIAVNFVTLCTLLTVLEP